MGVFDKKTFGGVEKEKESITDTIRIGKEILCLPYAKFFGFQLEISRFQISIPDQSKKRK